MPRWPQGMGTPTCSANFVGKRTNLTQCRFLTCLPLRTVHIPPQLAYSDPAWGFLNVLPSTVLLKKHKVARLNTPQMRELF